MALSRNNIQGCVIIQNNKGRKIKVYAKWGVL